MNLEPEFLALVRDPVGLDELEMDGEDLVNRGTHRRYGVVDGIPVLLDAVGLGPQNRRFQRMYDRLSRGYDLAEKIGDVFYRGKIFALRRHLAARTAVKPRDRCLYTSIGTGADLPTWQNRCHSHCGSSWASTSRWACWAAAAACSGAARKAISSKATPSGFPFRRARLTWWFM